MPHIAKVFRSGNSQAVRLPKDFRFTVDEVEVSGEGDAVILRPRPDAAGRWFSCARPSTAASARTSWPKAGATRPAAAPRSRSGVSMTGWLLATNAVIALVTRRSKTLLRRVGRPNPGARRFLDHRP